MTGTSALSDPRLSALTHEVTRHGRVSTLAEAAAARGVTPRQVIKTMVIRRGADDYLFVLVPGDRNISWPKLRQHLRVNRISMPDADEARAVTGYARGTITPFGSIHRWPVLADASLPETVSIGGGEHGVAITMASADLLMALNAETADVTEAIEAETG